jgi:Flp pilus assembly protein TadG
MIQKFNKDTQGATAVIFSIILTIPIFLVGAAIDYSQLSNIKTQAQDSLDGALLTALQSHIIESADINTTVSTYIQQHLEINNLNGFPIVTHQLNKNSLSGKLRGSIETSA